MRRSVATMVSVLLVGAGLVAVPAVAQAAPPPSQPRLDAATLYGAGTGWSVIKEGEPSTTSTAAARYVTGPAGVNGTGSLELTTGPGNPPVAGKVYVTRSFDPTVDAPTRLSAFSERTLVPAATGALAPYLNVELWNPTAPVGTPAYQNLVWTPGAVVTDTWQDWDTSGAAWVARRNAGGLVKGQAYDLATALSTMEGRAEGWGLLRASVAWGDSTFGGGYANKTAYLDGVALTLDGMSVPYDVDNLLGQCSTSDDPVSRTTTLLADCSTDRTLFVPQGWTVDGAGHSLVATETATTTFTGAILQNAGTTMDVRDLTVTTNAAWDDPSKNSGGDLVGIRFLAASGSVTGSSVTGVSHGNGVQEGKGILVDNRSHPANFYAHVTLDGVTVSRYQKNGIDVRGDVSARITGSTIGQSASPSGVRLDAVTAGNAVVVAYGATAVVDGNTITGNDWDGSGDWNATGLLAYQAGNVTVTRNVFDGPGSDVAADLEVSGDLVVSCNLIARGPENVEGLDLWATGLLVSGNHSVTANGNTFAGWRDDTSGVVSTTGGACLPTAPTVVVDPASVTATSALVTWTPGADLPYAPDTGWQLVDPAGVTHDLAPGTSQYPLTGLTPGAAATVQVRALNAAGNGPVGSATVTPPVPPVPPVPTAPGEVQGLQVSGLTASGLTLTWAPVTGATSYDVVVGAVTASVPDPTTTFTATGLTPATPYLVTVRARNGVGAGPAAASLAVTAPAAPAPSLAAAMTVAPTLLGYGQRTTVRVAASAGGTAVQGATVTVQRRALGGRWVGVGTATTAADGRAVVSLVATATADYRALVSGSGSATTGTVRVSVRSSVAVTAPSAVRAGARFTVTGSVAPRLAGDTVLLQRKIGARWVTVRTATLSSTSRYALTVRYINRGTWTFRVVANPRSGYLAGYSRVFGVRVR